MGLIRKFLSGKKAPERTYSELGVDIHSHLIPGIDDGAKTMEESIELIQALSHLGYKKLITTPHIMYDAYRNSSEIILSGLDLLRKEIAVRNIDIDIEAAAEYYLDEHFLKLLNSNALMTFGSNYVLFETSYVARPYGLHEHIYAILSHGYKPVLAHPERYVYLHESYDEYRKIKDMGVLFQVNINSLIGYYTNPVKKAAEWIVENGLVDFVGSDTHKMRHVHFLEKAQTHPNFQKIFDHNTLLNQSLL
ncbi:MAG: capsular biosynthesis protein [Sulfuricurvum sp.]|jgi:tyrosine-protein phosphatase YwqE|uniref:tyrosine-protein phosphatase n=1 Tax=Sulfuricurvum sp. TaxID=2025608 RepID=UPI0025DD50D9|nr:CpsB/CapC family capsule biosynthesis tyrosine phosphatase [Sulfuricurvum sp.]MCK9372297.1 capsular biosynthesis protein [Sulfuricurvum sp.]